MSESSEQYAKRVREGCFKAILNASVTKGELRLNEREIYDGVISAIAMIHASQDEVPTAEKTALVSNEIARYFRERVEEVKIAKEQNGCFLMRKTH
jgi:hypothetical protein